MCSLKCVWQTWTSSPHTHPPPPIHAPSPCCSYHVHALIPHLYHPSFVTLILHHEHRPSSRHVHHTLTVWTCSHISTHVNIHVHTLHHGHQLHTSPLPSPPPSLRATPIGSIVSPSAPMGGSWPPAVVTLRPGCGTCPPARQTRCSRCAHSDPPARGRGLHLDPTAEGRYL